MSSLIMLNVLVWSWCSVALISASAIPMWEYLNKDEKTAYLYNMFENQVDEFCNFSEIDDCKKELLTYGLKNLHNMPEDHLDTMDPFQRNAHQLIWDSMMEGHATQQKNKQQPNRPSSSSQVTDPYELSDNTDSNYLGAASSRQETIAENINGRFIIAQPQQRLRPARHYGPMMVRVYPDGRPVLDDVITKSIPIDDDSHHYEMIKTVVPRRL